MGLNLTASQLAAAEGVFEAVRERARATPRRRPSIPGESSPSDVSFIEYLPGDRKVVSILGGRGSGKTSVLSSVLSRLRSEGSFSATICEPLVPESFLTVDHPFAWIVAGIEERVTLRLKILREAGAVESHRALSECLDAFGARARLALSDAEGGQVLVQESIVQKADELGVVSRAGFRLRRSLTALLDQLFVDSTSVEGNPRGSVLVVACDDVDLFPEHLDRLLPFLHMLAADPRIVVIIAADEELIRNYLEKKALSHFSNAPERAASLAESQLKKLLPYDLRFSIRRLTELEVMDFAPDGSETSVRELLGSFRLRESEIGPGTLLELFEAGVRRGGTGLNEHAALLPRDPRSLVQFHAALNRQVSGQSARSGAGAGPSEGGTDFRSRNRAVFELLVKFALNCEPLPPQAVRDIYSFESGKAVEMDVANFQSGSHTRPVYVSEDGWRIVYLVRTFAESDGSILPPSHSALFYLASDLRGVGVEAMFRGKAIQFPGERSDFRFFVHDSRGKFGWPIPRIPMAWMQLRMQECWRAAAETYTEEMGGFRVPPGDDRALWSLRFLDWYLQSITEAPRRRPKLDLAIRGIRELLEDSHWERRTIRAGELGRLLRESERANDALAASIRVSLSDWIARFLAVLSDERAAFSDEVARRARWLRDRLAREWQLEPEEIDVGQQDAIEFLSRAEVELVSTNIEEIDLQALIADVLAGDREAIGRATILVQQDRRPSQKRRTLEAVLAAIGVPPHLLPPEVEGPDGEGPSRSEQS